MQHIHNTYDLNCIYKVKTCRTLIKLESLLNTCSFRSRPYHKQLHLRFGRKSCVIRTITKREYFDRVRLEVKRCLKH